MFVDRNANFLLVCHFFPLSKTKKQNSSACENEPDWHNFQHIYGSSITDTQTSKKKNISIKKKKNVYFAFLNKNWDFHFKNWSIFTLV